jgi:hypothetical protein
VATVRPQANATYDNGTTFNDCLGPEGVVGAQVVGWRWTRDREESAAVEARRKYQAEVLAMSRGSGHFSALTKDMPLG